MDSAIIGAAPPCGTRVLGGVPPVLCLQSPHPSADLGPGKTPAVDLEAMTAPACDQKAAMAAGGDRNGPPRVLTAVVTFNRLRQLQNLVGALRAQKTPAAATVIVDNSSSDGTREWLEQQHDLIVVRLPNQGSAGGFNAALQWGFREGYDWIWLMDDDTVPRPDALERLLASPAIARSTTGFIYSLQVYPDGTVPTNDPGPTGPQEWALTVLQDRCIPVRQCSFVAMMVSRRAVEDVGFPLKEMFFMGDDTEYSRRIVGGGYKGYCVLDSIVLHDTRLPTAWDIRSWSPLKKRFASRNTVFLVRTSEVPVPRKAWMLFRLFTLEFYRLARGTSDLSVIAWLFKGLYFNPPVERPHPLERESRT